MRDECLNGKIFYSLKEAQIVIEKWWVEYNTRRPHSALGYGTARKSQRTEFNLQMGPHSSGSGNCNRRVLRVSVLLWRADVLCFGSSQRPKKLIYTVRG